MRILAATVVVLSCGAMGLIAAGSYAQRVRNLRQLISFIQTLESEINFARSILPRIVEKQIPHYSGALQEFLIVVNENLMTGSGEQFSSVWNEGLKVFEKNGFPPTVIGELRDFGKSLGQSDVLEQNKNLLALLSHLELALDEAKDERHKQTRLWQYLGFSTGLLIVLLLF